MGNGRMVNVGDLVEGQLLVKLHAGISLVEGRLAVLRELFHPEMPGHVMLLRHEAPCKTLRYVLQTRIDQRRPTAGLERGVEIPHRMQLVVYPAQVNFVVVMPESFCGEI